MIVFFVLSGSWVGGSVLAQVRARRFSWWSFLVRRLSRLWIVLVPALVLALGLAPAGLAWFGGTDVYRGSAAYDLVVRPEMGEQLTAAVFFGHVFFPRGIAVPVFAGDVPLWSLAYAVAYYLIFPAALGVVYPRRPLTCAVSGLAALALAAWAGAAIMVLFPVWVLGAPLAWRRDRIARWLAARPPTGWPRTSSSGY